MAPRNTHHGNVVLPPAASSTTTTEEIYHPPGEHQSFSESHFFIGDVPIVLCSLA